jgi:hypothetical protein
MLVIQKQNPYQSTSETVYQIYGDEGRSNVPYSSVFFFDFSLFPLTFSFSFFLRFPFLHLDEVSYFGAASRLSTHYESVLPYSLTIPPTPARSTNPTG